MKRKSDHINSSLLDPALMGSVASVENEFRIWYKGIKIEPNAISYFLQITQTF